MKVKTAKRWFLWHKWTSLICTIFLLHLCITGLPLIFHEELDHLLNPPVETSTTAGKSKLSVDLLVKNAEKANPGKIVRYAFWDQEEHPNQVLVDVVKNVEDHYDQSKYILLDEYTGAIIGEPKLEGFLYVVFRLHVDVFAGIPGKFFMGLMGILFMISIVSGIVLYGPIMKNFDFGMIRKNRSQRLKWLDTHNFLGIVITAWMVVVGFTGVINAFSDVILGLWQQGQLAEMTAPYKNKKPIEGPLSSIDSALKIAKEKTPGMDVSVLAFPGTSFTSKHHYAIFLRGNTEVTSKLLKPVLIDAETGFFTDSRTLPWYANMLFLSEPLHFGNYGGMPLKIIWTVFDVFTIIVLITGLYLWFARRKSQKKAWKKLQLKHA